MSDNLIGSNKLSGKKITDSLGFDDMYIKAGINWVLNQTKVVGVDIHNYLMISSLMN